MQVQETGGTLAASVSIRDLKSGSTETRLCVSVLQAVEHAIDALTDSVDKTGVIVVGEDVGPAEVEATLAARSSALAKVLAQPGLFMTLAAQDIVRDRLLNDVRFEDFGIYDPSEEEKKDGNDSSGVIDALSDIRHPISDISHQGVRPERLFAVLHPDLPEPALPHKKITGNCPRLHKSFVGRHRERDELQDMILHRKLVTITGFPGVGKSTTAIHVARSFDEEYTDGVWWFSVDDRTSMDELLQAIASARGLLSLQGPVTIERVAEGLAQKHGIILLDGCESMASDVGALCTAILDKCQTLTLLLTGTRPLGIADEFVYRLEPMSMPRPTDTGEDALIGSDALALFFERATQTGERLALSDQNIDYATTICERVDGLPLAIELVAASLRSSSLKKIASDVAEKHANGNNGSSGLTGRLQSLEKVLQLSYKPLDQEQRDLLHRLAMFRGEWKLDMAQQLWGETFAEPTMERLHQVLVDSSWIAYNPDRDTYRMLHTVRSFCQSKAGLERNSILSRFCSRMGEIAAKACADLQGTDSFEAEVLLGRHYSDFLFSLEVCIGAPGMADGASALMKSMVHFWRGRNFLDDAERISNAYLATGVTDMEAARALVMLGVVHFRRRRLDDAIHAYEQCLPLTRTAHNRIAEASTLMNLGLALKEKGDLGLSLAYTSEALEILRNQQQPTLLCQALSNAAGTAVRWASEVGLEAEARGLRLAEAQRYQEEAEFLSPSVDPVTMQSIWHGRALLAMARNQLDEAESCFNRAVYVCARHSLRHEAGQAAEGLAEINLERGLGPTAAKLLGLSRQIRRESGKNPTEAETERYGLLAQRVYEQVDQERADKLMSYGEKLDVGEILTPTIFNV